MGPMQLRIGKLFAVFVVLLVVAGGRTFYLGALRAGKLRQVADGQQVTEVTVPALRGAIVDRNGVPLAGSAPGGDSPAPPSLAPAPGVAARRIATVLGLPEATVERDLTKPHSGFV